jgi:hypothetical protein
LLRTVLSWMPRSPDFACARVETPARQARLKPISPRGAREKRHSASVSFRLLLVTDIEA